jgi:hypothetical protein
MAGCAARRGFPKFDFDQGRREPVRPCFSRQQGRSTMTTETAMIVAAITVAFIGFAATLW